MARMAEVIVTQTVEVTVDESKFTPEFMAEFRRYFYEFDTLEEHLEHLGQLHARGMCDEFSFIEGYGPAKDFGIKFRITDQEEEALGPARKIRQGEKQ